MADKINATLLRAIVASMNAECERMGLSSGYELERAHGGYKLTANDGSRDVWHERMTAREAYYRIHAYRDGMRAAHEQMQTD